MAMMRPWRFVLSGYYGCGNAGDEAVLAGIKAGFQRLAGERVQLLVLSQNPQATTALHNLDAVYRMQLASVKQALLQSDMLLCGGGSLLQDATSLRSLLYYLLVMALAQRLRRPVMFFAQGLGPLHRALSRRLVRAAAERAAYITVRDEESAWLLRQIGVRNASIEVTADPAFCLLPDDSAEPLLKERTSLKRPLIGVALRSWGAAGEQTARPYLQLLSALEAVCEAQPILIPMQQPQDVAFARALIHQSGLACPPPLLDQATSPHQLLSAIAHTQGTIAMRLHALIFAVRAGVPPFALRYDQKIESQMRLFGLEQNIAHWHDFDPYGVAERVKEILAQQAIYRDRLSAVSQAMEERALRNMEIALKVIGAC
jgi:polysaccharide pyruvyl transferase CsaB